MKEEFALIGELLHGDYNQFVGDDMLHSCTNYECYKGLFSSFNCMNMFEINHSLQRQFGNEQWCIYRGKHLLSFVDNHDVSRIASILTNEKHLPLIYGMLFAMPGIPCIYYGSEWGAKGDKKDGDTSLRLSYEKPEFNELSELIKKLSEIKKNSEALNYGGFKSLHLTNKQCIFERCSNSERILCCINADENEYTAYFDAGAAKGTDLITGETVSFEGGLKMDGYSLFIVKM